MISEICDILQKEGFDIKIGNGIIITKDGFSYTMEGKKFIELCEVLSRADSFNSEKDTLIHDSKRTHTNVK